MRVKGISLGLCSMEHEHMCVNPAPTKRRIFLGFVGRVLAQCTPMRGTFFAELAACVESVRFADLMLCDTDERTLTDLSHERWEDVAIDSTLQMLLVNARVCCC
eukprot:TRINITY_DN495_c0_g1_i4.p2 TRINITY_DN495_c0_g1~~TRINITY_DN495_c0_g1_i4.p2  ORF type:complete len:104 (-),score=0.91 TRINITY_DN495_c0_g1_i4:94-405(-)